MKMHKWAIFVRPDDRAMLLQYYMGEEDLDGPHKCFVTFAEKGKDFQPNSSTEITVKEIMDLIIFERYAWLGDGENDYYNEVKRLEEAPQPFDNN